MKSIPYRGFMSVVTGGILTAIVVMAVYWPARENGFVWDDWAIVDRSASNRDPALWREALLRAPADYAVMFRPFATFTFLLQLWAGHSEPQPFHVVNLIIHLANVFLLTLIAWRLLEDDTSRAWTRPALASLCGLIYGVHPALIEPVTWISCRYDLVMTFSLCLALLFDRVLPGSGWKRALAVGICFLAAMLSKETAVGFMLALPIVHLAFRHPPTSTHNPGSLIRAFVPHYPVYAALLGALALYFTARFAVSGSSLGWDEMISPARYIETFGQHVLGVAASLAQHVWSAVWPFQNVVPSRSFQLPINATVVLPVIAAGAGASAAILLAARAGAAGRVLGLLFMAFLAALLPVANIIPLPSSVNELWASSRYLTFPLIFACLAVPFALRITAASLAKHVRHGPVLLGVIVGAWVLASVANVRVTIPLWKDDAILNSWAIQSGGPSFWRYGNLGAHYVQIGDLPRAREAFTAAIKLRDDEHTAWVWENLGIVEVHLGDRARALQAFQRAVELAPENVKCRVHLAMVQRAVGDSKLAMENLENGLNRIRASGRPDGQEGRLRHELGLAYADLGRREEAIAQLNVALALARDSQERTAVEEALRSIAPRR
jgi:hypothetical protein